LLCLRKHWVRNRNGYFHDIKVSPKYDRDNGACPWCGLNAGLE